MRRAIALLLCSLSLPAQAAETPCNITANVTDPDPNGLNMRASPSSSRIVGTLKNTADWIEVHITGMDGDWYAIDSAKQIGDDRVVFTGRAYVHKSKVGVSGLQDSATLYIDHDVKSRVLVSGAAGDQPTALLACWGDFYQVHIKDGTGWTKTVCNNEFTTCS